MKKTILLLSVLALAACDNPKYDLTLSCEDGAKGTYLVEAKIYETKADLTITRLSKELRNKHKEWLADHTWLYNQIPSIDDKIEISVPAIKPLADYREDGHIRFDMHHDSLNGGLRFTLWHAADNLTTSDGYPIPNGEWTTGTPCDIVIDRQKQTYKNIDTTKLKEIKECAAYMQSQSWSYQLDGQSGYFVFDENSDREMFISKEQMNIFTNGVEFHHFFLDNMRYYFEDAKHACDVATKLRTYIKENIDTAGAPIYVAENMHCGYSDNPETTKIEIYRRYAKVSFGNLSYRMELTSQLFGDDVVELGNTYSDDSVNLMVNTSINRTQIGFVFMNQRCFFDETEEFNPAQRKQTKVVDQDTLNKIFKSF